MKIKVFIIENKACGKWFHRRVVMGTFRDALAKAHEMFGGYEYRVRRIETLEQCRYTQDKCVPFSCEREGLIE